MDVSVIEKAIPDIVAFGRRTMIEQCVTSAAIICLDAQAATVAVAIGTIDAELQVDVIGITKTGRPSKAKKPRNFSVTTQKAVRVPLAVLIVMSRTNPASAYSQMTGNRWPLSLGSLPKGPGSSAGRQAMIATWISRMTLARHSSTHFLQHGWTPGIRALLADPNFVGWKSRGRSTRAGRITAGNIVDPMLLGSALVAISADACLVTAANDVGGDGNEVLAAKHRAALIAYGTIPLQEAIDKESVAIVEKTQEYLDRGLKQRFP